MHCRDVKDIESIKKKTLTFHAGLGPKIHFGILTNSVYVCLLDARKAFDTVWYPGLFLKLNQMGCNMHLWKILWDYYQGFQCSVFVAGRQTAWFPVEQGVHQ